MITSRSGEDVSTVDVETLLKYVRVGLLLICDANTEGSLEVFSVGVSRVGVSNVVWLLLDPETSEVFSVAVVAVAAVLVAAIRVTVSACKIVALIMQSCIQSAPSCEAGWGLDMRLFIV